MEIVEIIIMRMNMKKIFLLAVLIGAMPVAMMAQDDDLDFTPKKKTDSNSSLSSEQPAYYVGSNRDVDEYNRRGKYWSHYLKIGSDGKGNDKLMAMACTQTLLISTLPLSASIMTLWSTATTLTPSA